MIWFVIVHTIGKESLPGSGRCDWLSDLADGTPVDGMANGDATQTPCTRNVDSGDLAGMVHRHTRRVHVRELRAFDHFSMLPTHGFDATVSWL